MGKKFKMQATKKTLPVALVGLDKSSVFAEQCRMILNNIKFSSTGRFIKSIVITSSEQGEGKSTIAANVAITANENNHSVLLVDCDLRRPTVGHSFILSSNHGLSNILTSDLQDISYYIQKNVIENLDIITSGPKPPNPSELLSSPRMENLIKEVYDQYDMIIFDCPPVLGMTDTPLMTSKADGVLLVAREGISKKESLIKAKESLMLSSANLLGVVFNRDTKAEETYYY